MGHIQIDVRIRNPKDANGKQLVTTVKTRVEGSVQEPTLKRTVKGEHADLQLKFINHPNGKVKYLHIHCQNNYWEASWMNQ